MWLLCFGDQRHLIAWTRAVSTKKQIQAWFISMKVASEPEGLIRSPLVLDHAEQQIQFSMTSGCWSHLCFTKLSHTDIDQNLNWRDFTEAGEGYFILWGCMFSDSSQFSVHFPAQGKKLPTPGVRQGQAALTLVWVFKERSLVFLGSLSSQCRDKGPPEGDSIEFVKFRWSTVQFGALYIKKKARAKWAS